MSTQAPPIPGAPPSPFAVRRFWPVVTYVILALNFLIFLLMTLAGGSKNVDILLDFGAAYGPFLRHGEYWRLVMPMFLHIGWLHLLVNSYALYVLGPILERVYGAGRFALLYVLMGMGGALLSMTRSPSVSAGASGAIMGIAGAMLVSGFVHREMYTPRWRRALWTVIVPFVVITLAMGYRIPNIDNWGHIGGLASGMILALLIPPPGRDAAAVFSGERPSQAIVAIPIIIVALAMAATADHYGGTRGMVRLLQDGLRAQAARQPEQALARFREAARRAPQDDRPHALMGQLFLQMKRPDDAVREFKETLRLNPGSQEAQLGLGFAYQMKGDLANARPLLEKALGKNSNSAESQEILADLYAAQKQYSEAVAHYEQALRIKPDFAVAHNNLAWLYATSEDPEYRNPTQALQHATRAVELTKWKEPGFIDTLAEAYYAAGNFADAVKTQARTLQLDPSNAEFQQHMSRYRQAAGM